MSSYRKRSLKIKRNLKKFYKRSKNRSKSMSISKHKKDIAIVKNVKYIVGPISVTEHISPEFNKKFLIFGDIHSYNTVCPKDYSNKNTIHFNNYLQKLFKTRDENGDLKQFDLFVEFDYKPKHSKKIYEGIEGFFKRSERYPENIYFSQLYDEFYECFKVDKKDCKFKNVRFHYADVRIGKEIQVVVEDLWFDILDFINLLEEGELSHKQIKYFETLFKNKYKPSLINKNLINFKNLLIKNKIDKQIENVTDSFIKHLLLDMKNTFLKESIDLTKIYESDIYDFFTVNLKDNFDSKIKVKKLEKFEQRLADLHTSLMDMYTIGRIFRVYKDGSQNSENIIIFAGDFHSNVYREFLTKIGFKTINKTFSEKEGKDFQCINVSRFSKNSMLIR